MESTRLVLGGREWSVTRARLGGFLRIQTAQREVREATKDGDNGLIADALYGFLKAGLAGRPEDDLDRGLFETAPWFEVVTAFLLLTSLNEIPNASSFAILHGRGGKPVPWDHPLRQSIIWIHLIASTYGWSRSEIEDLWPEEAIAFVQEIVADLHSDREFSYSLSEIAWNYDKAGKKRHLRPMARPRWMVVGAGGAAPARTRLHRSALPQGMVVYPKGADDADAIPRPRRSGG